MEEWYRKQDYFCEERLEKLVAWAKPRYLSFQKSIISLVTFLTSLFIIMRLSRNENDMAITSLMK